MVKVSVHDVIDMVAVRNRLMAALSVVAMLLVMAFAGVSRRACGRVARTDRQRMLVHVVAVDVVHVPVMQIIRVSLMRDRLVSAAGAVRMGMSFVDRMVTHDAPP